MDNNFKILGIPVYVPMSRSMESQYAQASRNRLVPFIRACLLAAIILESFDLVYQALFEDRTLYFGPNIVIILFYSILLLTTFIRASHSLIHGIGVIGIVGTVLFLAILIHGINGGMEKMHSSFFVALQLIPILSSFIAASIAIWGSIAIIFHFIELTDMDAHSLNYVKIILIYYGITATVISYFAAQHRRASFITEKKFEKAMREAKKANKTKSTILATMSHEVRTPLNGILGFVTLMQNTKLTAKQKDYIETVKYSGETVLAILNDILDFSKTEAGKFDIEHVDFNLERLIRSVLMLMTSRAEEKGLTLDFIVAPDIPVFVKSDPTRIRQVLLNLVGNAIKFTAEGSISVHVSTVQPQTDPLRLHFSVIDTGIGLSQEARSRLFREFTQSDSPISRKYGGTGLGLAICKKIADLMNGTISVSSKEGQGSTFHFEIPVAAAESQTLKDDTQETQTSGTKAERIPVLKPLNILLAEDNAINRKVITGLLEHANQKVTIAENGENAVEFLRKRKKPYFDLVLMDMQMPVMDGLRATEEIRKLRNKNKEIPIIALTANNIKGDEQRCLAAGMNGYVSKPIDLAVLLHEIAKLIPDSVMRDEERQKAPLSAPENFAYLAEVEQMMGKPYIQTFIAEGLEKIEQLIDAISGEKAPENMKYAAHDLKGLSDMLGLPDVQALSEAIEMACAEGNAKEAENLARILESRYRENHTILEQEYISKI